MAIYCRVCGFSSFRTSRFHFQISDLLHLLLLCLPVRCSNCDERAFTSIKQFLDVRRSRKAHRRINKNINRSGQPKN
jgi:hypothetical protein